MDTPVLVLVADDLPRAVRCAVCGLAGHFGLAVAVEIVDHELRVVLAVADVDA